MRRPQVDRCSRAASPYNSARHRSPVQTEARLIRYRNLPGFLDPRRDGEPPPRSRRQYLSGPAGSLVPWRWRETAALDDTPRAILCARCRTRVLICRRCDRGQIYCSRECSAARRRESQRASEHRYRKSEIGRRNNAARQRRYRERRERECVTHQGPLDPAPAAQPASRHAASTDEPTPSQLATDASPSPPTYSCAFCGRACSDFARPTALRRRGMPRTWP